MRHTLSTNGFEMTRLVPSLRSTGFHCRNVLRITHQRRRTMSISARNQLKGKISDIVLGDVMAEVTIRVGQNIIDAIITRRSAEELKLKKGDAVIAVIKATEVMVSKGN